MKHNQMPDTGTRLFKDVVILDEFVSDVHIREYTRETQPVPQRWPHCAVVVQAVPEYYITGVFQVVTVWKYSKKHNKLLGLKPEIFYDIQVTGPMTERVEAGDVAADENGVLFLTDDGKKRLGIKSIEELEYGNSNK